MFTGCGTALVTPFKKDLSLDEDTLRRLVRRQIDAGIELPGSLRHDRREPDARHAEHLRVVEITLEEAKGKVPVVAGAGGYNTAEVIHLAKELETMGVDGILSVTPYYNKPTQEGLYQHYKAIASAVRLPHHRLQRAGAHRRQRRAGHAEAPGRDRQHRRREGGLRKHRADRRHSEPGARALRGALRRRCADHAR